MKSKPITEIIAAEEAAKQRARIRNLGDWRTRRAASDAALFAGHGLKKQKRIAMKLMYQQELPLFSED